MSITKNQTSAAETAAVNTEQSTQWKKQINEAFSLFDEQKQNTIHIRDIPTLVRYLGYFPSEKQLSEIIIPQCVSQQYYKTATNTSSSIVSNGTPLTNTTTAINEEIAIDFSKINAITEIDYNVFELNMLLIIKQQLYKCDDEETIIQAFQMIKESEMNENIDSDDKNSANIDDNEIDSEFLMKIMTELNVQTYALNEKEMKDFLQIGITAIQSKTGSKNRKRKMFCYMSYIDELFLQLKDRAK